MATTVEKIRYSKGQPNNGAKILARSFYRELLENGYSDEQIVEFSSELISCIADNLENEDDQELEPSS